MIAFLVSIKWGKFSELDFFSLDDSICYINDSIVDGWHYIKADSINLIDNKYRVISLEGWWENNSTCSNCDHRSVGWISYLKDLECSICGHVNEQRFPSQARRGWKIL